MFVSLLTMFFFSFSDPVPTDICSLSLHDALPIYPRIDRPHALTTPQPFGLLVAERSEDRKSTRLNSSHVATSYAGFCLKTEQTQGDVSKWPSQLCALAIFLIWLTKVQIGRQPVRT